MSSFGSETAERIARLYAMTLAAFRDPRSRGALHDAPRTRS